MLCMYLIMKNHNYNGHDDHNGDDDLSTMMINIGHQVLTTNPTAVPHYHDDYMMIIMMWQRINDDMI